MLHIEEIDYQDEKDEFKEEEYESNHKVLQNRSENNLSNKYEEENSNNHNLSNSNSFNNNNKLNPYLYEKSLQELEHYKNKYGSQHDLENFDKDDDFVLKHSTIK